MVGNQECPEKIHRNIQKGNALRTYKRIAEQNKNIELKNAKINIKDQIILEKKEKISKIFVGGNFNVRYVPQSRYFEPLDLHSKPVSLDKEKLKQLYLKKRGKISRCFHFQENDKSFTLKVEV